MRKFIVITGASKGIGRASADSLVKDGWSVIGIARRSPANFPGEFIQAALTDRNKTETLARELAARGGVLGIQPASRTDSAIVSATLWREGKVPS